MNKKLIAKWDAVKKALDELKAQELSLRKEVYETLDFSDDFTGAKTLEIAEGVKLKVSVPENWSVDPDSLKEICKANKINIKKLTRVKVEIQKKELNLLDENLQAEVMKSVSVKPGTPQIKLENKNGN